MEFNQNHAKDTYLIRSIKTDSIDINGTIYKQSCIIDKNKVSIDLGLDNISNLTTKHIELMLATLPEIIILGSGELHEFPKVKLLDPIAKANSGFEVMNNQSAARTYNVLVTEGRKVVCLIIL